MLRNVVFLCPRLAVVVRPAIHGRYFSGPVPVLREPRRRPFQGVRSPRVERRQLATEHAVEKVEQEDELRRQRDNRRDTHQLIEVGESTKRLEVGERVIPSGESGDTDVVHREEDQVDTGERNPEVDVAEPSVNHTAEHFGEPVINTGEHPEEGSAYDNQVEVRHYEVGVVQLNIDRRVTEEYPGNTSRKEERHHPD